MSMYGHYSANVNSLVDKSRSKNRLSNQKTARAWHPQSTWITRITTSDWLPPFNCQESTVSFYRMPSESALRLACSCALVSSIDRDQSFARPSAARFASHGIAAGPSICANGPSVSVRTRFFGMAPASSRPFWAANIAGPTLKQQPWSMAFPSSLRVPENQCKIGVPAPLCAANRVSTADAARRLWIDITLPPASAQRARM